MRFDSIKQLKESMRGLGRFYPLIRIWDSDRKQILYEAEGTAMSETAPVSCAFHGATLTIREKEGRMEASIPVVIDGRPCRLELTRRCEKTGDPVSLPYMKKLILTDCLTNLYNRRYIDEKLPLDLVRAFQDGRPVSFIYSDIDFFKRVNDEYGHVAGDHVLRETAYIFHSSLRKKQGWAARYGGDEFLVCLPETDHGAAVRLANRIRQSVEKRQFRVKNHLVRITCSFGVQTVYKTSGVNQIIGLLDRKLYQAKKSGRNRVIG